MSNKWGGGAAAQAPYILVPKVGSADLGEVLGNIIASLPIYPGSTVPYGWIQLRPGRYTMLTTPPIFSPIMVLKGAGQQNTVISFPNGNGSQGALVATNPNPTTPDSLPGMNAQTPFSAAYGGGIFDLSLDLTGSVGQTPGIRIYDIEGYIIENVTVQNANATSGGNTCIGLLMECVNTWCEKSRIRMVTKYVKTSVLMQVVTGAQQISFGQNRLDLRSYIPANGNGIQIINGGKFYNGELKMTAVINNNTNNGSVITLSGQGGAGNTYACMVQNHMDIWAEWGSANTPGNFITISTPSSNLNEGTGCCVIGGDGLINLADGGQLPSADVGVTANSWSFGGDVIGSTQIADLVYGTGTNHQFPQQNSALTSSG